jgi:signal transduction histidine kinase
MDEETKLKLFQPFQKVASSRMMNNEGVGLGLSIVKSLCEALSFKLNVES